MAKECDYRSFSPNQADIKKQVDYIIIGQGLAGSTLALQLIARGKRVVVFDKPENNHCSIEAAGLFNPITGKVFSKTWLADKIFPTLHSFYPKAEALLNSTFFHPQPVYRPFVSIEEQNEWMGKSSDPFFGNYIHHISGAARFDDQVNGAYGGIELKQCGCVNVVSFLKSTQTFLQSKDSFVSSYLDESEIISSNQGIETKSLVANKVIFTNGVAANNSSFFNWLPVRPLKGETLTVDFDVTLKSIFNRGVYIVPLEQSNRYKVGATYQQHDKDATATGQGRAELEEKLLSLVKIPFKVVGQGWGFRPTTPDRRPILGAHPDYQNVVIFNGLGTKGVSLAPYFSEQLADWLVGKGEISPEVNINRFNALYSKSLGVGSNL